MASKKFILPTEDNIGKDKFQDYRKFKTKRLIKMRFSAEEYKKVKKALTTYLEKITYSNSFKIIPDELGVPNLLLLGFPKVIVSIGSIGNSTKLWEFFVRPQTVEQVAPYMYEVGEIDFPVMKIYSGFYCEVENEMEHYALLNEEEFYYIKWGNVILRENLIDEFIFGTPQMKQIWKDALINAQNEYMRLKNGGALTTTIEVSQDQIWNEPSCSSSSLETRSVSTQQEVNQSGNKKSRNQKTLSDEQVDQIIRMLIKDLKAKKSNRNEKISISSSANNLKRTLDLDSAPVVKKTKISSHKVENKSNRDSDKRKNVTTKQTVSKNKCNSSSTKKNSKQKSQNNREFIKTFKSDRKFEKKQNNAFTSSKTSAKQPLKYVSISNDKLKMKDKSRHFNNDKSKSNKVEHKRTIEKDKIKTKPQTIAQINIEINQTDEQKLQMQSQGKTIKVVCEIEIGESSKTSISHSVVSSTVTTSEQKQSENTNNETSDAGTEPQTDPKPNDKPSTSSNSQTSNSESSSESSSDETEPIDQPNQNIVDPKPNEESDKFPNNSTSNSTELSKNNLKVKTPNLLLRIPKSDAPNEWYSRYIRDTSSHKDSVSNALTQIRKFKSKSTNQNASGASTKGLTSIEKYIESRKLFPSNSKLTSESIQKRSSSDLNHNKTKSNKQTDKVKTTIQRSQSKPTNKDNTDKKISKMKSFNLKYAKALQKDHSNLFRPDILKPDIIVEPSEIKNVQPKVTQVFPSNSINPQSSSKTLISFAPALNIPMLQSNPQTKQNPLIQLAQNGREFLVNELIKHRALVLTMVHYVDYERNCFSDRKQYHLLTVVHYVVDDNADQNDDNDEAPQFTTRTLDVSLVENIDSNTILGEFVRVITQFKLTQKYLLVAGDETLLNGIPSQCRMSENMIYSMITYLNLYYWRVHPLCEQSILQAVGVELERYKWPYNGIKPFEEEKFRIDYDAELKKYWKSIIANQYDLDFGQSIYNKAQTSINRKDYPNLFKAANFYRSYLHSKDIEQIKNSFIPTCDTVSSLNRNGKLSRDTMSAWSFINMNRDMFESDAFRSRFGCVWDQVVQKQFGFEMNDSCGSQS